MGIDCRKKGKAHIVLLINDLDGRNALRNTIFSFYEKNGNRPVSNFLDSEENGFFYVHFLINRKHVIRYSVGRDRGIFVGGVSLAIGPHYFGPYDFWDYENSERFSMEASTEAVENNLSLLDEFLGYAFAISKIQRLDP